MRLIDADELDIYDVSPAYGMCVMGVTQEDIDDAPTVEAIPIEWMKQKYPAAVNSDSTRYISKVELLNEIIEEWRKEE